MASPLFRWPEPRRNDAVTELVAELAEFSYDGLVQLRRDLERGRVLRGGWAGCVLSYRRGAAGSARRDRNGRTRNAFTALWDGGWMTDREVMAAVLRTLRSRDVGIAGAGRTDRTDPVARA